MLTLTRTPDAGNLLRVVEYLLKDRDEHRVVCSRLMPLAGIDARSLGAVLRVEEQLAFNGHVQEAKALLSHVDADKIYEENHSLKDLNQRIGSAMFLRQDIAYDKALPLIERDWALGRTSHEGRLNYAQALCMVGRDDEAEAVVEEAYDLDHTLVNGFARCRCTTGPLLYEADQALPWLERDAALGRLVSSYRIYHAFVLGEAGDLDRAVAMVDDAYEQHEAYRNSFAELGFRHHAVAGGQPEKALSFVERDRKLERLTPGNGVSAALHALLGDFAGACATVEESYALSAHATGNNLLIGFCDYAVNRNLDRLQAMADKEARLNRIGFPHMEYVYAAIMLRCGEVEKAETYVARAARRTGLAERLALQWLRRVPCLGEEAVGEFLTPELGQMFREALEEATHGFQDFMGRAGDCATGFVVGL